MSMLEWARKEIEIACKRENPDCKDGEWDYGCACYESALKAFESLLEDEHSGFSIQMTRTILNRLIDGKPLTPIEDTDDVWNKATSYKDGATDYQCTRMSSLFKDVHADGTVTYTDIDRSYCVDSHNPNCTYSSGLVRRIIDEMFPITMPYMPDKPIKVYCEEFLTDMDNGDFDTVGILYCLKEENSTQKRIEINRFFREPEGNEEGQWTEISQEEYLERRRRRIKEE